MLALWGLFQSSVPTLASFAKILPSLVVEITEGEGPLKPPVGNVAYPYDSLPATGTPSSYHMGASLEDVNNQALQSGSHTDTTNVKGTTYLTLGCNGVLTSRYCYDVVP
jgi:hypothetical protein